MSELNDILTQEQRGFGLWVTEAPADPNIINLIGPNGSVVKSFNKPADPESIRKAADKAMGKFIPRNPSAADTL